MAADDAQRLHDIELHELTKKLQKQLKTDIARYQHDTLFLTDDIHYKSQYSLSILQYTFALLILVHGGFCDFQDLQ